MSYAVAYLGRFEGPDHLYPTCPALARVTPWNDPWPFQVLYAVDPEASDMCGWCQRVWRARQKTAATTEARKA